MGPYHTEPKDDPHYIAPLGSTSKGYGMEFPWTAQPLEKFAKSAKDTRAPNSRPTARSRLTRILNIGAIRAFQAPQNRMC